VTGVLDLRQPGSATDVVAAAVTRCGTLRAAGLSRCADPDAPVGVQVTQLHDGFVNTAGVPVTDPTPEDLPLAAVLVTTDGQPSTVESVRTLMESSAPATAWLPWTANEAKFFEHRQGDQINRLSAAVLLATLLMAGFSLAVSVAGGLVERRRPFALLRLSGMRPAGLRGVLLAETAGPLLFVALASAGLGLAVIYDVTRVAQVTWQSPAPSYWWMLGGGLAGSLAVAVAGTFPLLGRLTSLATARFE
jgi:hypothetical protein